MKSDDMLSQIEEHFHVLPLGEKSLDFGKILSTDTSVKILETVYNSDGKVGLSASEISEALGVGRTTVIYHIGRMLESGLITINPVLKDDESWKHFWGLFRAGDSNVSKDQFNKLHESRMNGVKLFVPTKKGFLFLPSTDVDESRSIVKEVLTTLTAVAIEGNYKRMKKASSIIGAIGVLLMALSFVFQMPFLSAPALKASVHVESDQVSSLTAFERADLAIAPTAPLESQDTTEKSDRSVGGAEGKAESFENASLPMATPTAGSALLLPRLIFTAGIMFLGSFLGLLLFSFFFKRR